MMMKCRECGRSVSSQAFACPGCGAPIAMKAGPFGGQEPGVTVRPDFWHDRNVGAIGAFIVIVIVLVIVALCANH